MTRARDTADTQDNVGGSVPPNPAGKNAIINGAFDIWQRGTSNAITTTAYVADRFCAYRGVAGSTVSRQATSDTTNLPFIQYCARVQRDSGNTSTSVIYFGQPVETINSIPLAGKRVTFSFYARAGANYSAASSALAVYLNTGTGTDQNVITGSYTGNAQPINQTATLTTTWQRFSYSATLATTATELSVFYGFTPVGTAGAADYVEITGVQLEVGSVATPFNRNAGTIQGELAACQRYYYRQTPDPASGNYAALATANNYGTTLVVSHHPFPTTMRTNPTVAVSAANTFYYYMGNTNYTPTAVAINTATSQFGTVTWDITGGTNGLAGYITALNNKTSTISWSAEL